MKKTAIRKKHTSLIIGNWKMNPSTLEKAEQLFGEIKKAVGTRFVSEVVIAAPSVFIGGINRIAKKTPIKLGAQDVFYEQAGAHTGEVSLPMLKSVGVSHVIIGHSERRAQGESNEEVQKNTAAVLQSGSTAVVCIGETMRDAHGDYFNVVESQLSSMLAGIKKAHLQRLVIAYEPVWAIGTQKHATAEDVQEMKLFIQRILADTFGRSAVAKVRILYGGSVGKDNAETLLSVGHADGFLVGGASLKPAEFAGIVQISDAYGKN